MIGLQKHTDEIQAKLILEIPEIHDHFENVVLLPLNILTTDWVISIFLNYLPLEISDVYLDMFFKYGWQALYETAIEVLRYYKNDIL